MKFVALICSVRLWLALVLSVTLGMGASAADIHPINADEIACMSADASAHHEADISGAGNDEEQRPAHKHHTHNCGPCHLHMVGMNSLAVSYVSPAKLNLRPGADQSLALAGPLGLYRPPRA